MEYTSNFTLDQLILNYSADLSSLGALTPSQIEEAEDYLYTESMTLIKTNLTPEEAFSVAKMRFGSPTDIALEFNKVQPSSFLLKVALYSLLGLFLIKAVTLLCKLPVLIYVLLSDMPGTHSFRVGACITMLLLILPNVVMVLKKPNFQQRLRKIMVKWYFPLFFAGLYIVDRTIMFLMTGATALSMEVWGSLFNASAWMLIVFYALVTFYLLINFRKKEKLIVI